MVTNELSCGDTAKKKQHLRYQHLYFCTSKASKLRTHELSCRDTAEKRSTGNKAHSTQLVAAAAAAAGGGGRETQHRRQSAQHSARSSSRRRRTRNAVPETKRTALSRRPSTTTEKCAVGFADVQMRRSICALVVPFVLPLLALLALPSCRWVTSRAIVDAAPSSSMRHTCSSLRPHTQVA